MVSSTIKNLFDVFVSMPYGSDQKSKDYWNRFYHEGILGTKALLDGRGYSLNFVRASEYPSALQLKESVKKIIEKSHICLGILTGLNPNVFWELGYAESKGKPIVLLVAEGVNEASYSPVLVSEVLKRAYNGKIFDADKIDNSLIMDFQQNLIPFLNIAVDIVKSKDSPGPQYSIYTNRSEAKLARVIATAQHTIDLITTNLSYYADFENFVCEIDGKKTYAFDDPIKRGVRVRILILNPESVIAEYRAKQLGKGHEVYEYRNQLRKSATAFFYRYLNSDNVDIRIYDDLPSQITLLIDNRVITGFVSRGHQARYNIHVEFNPSCEGVKETFEQHFAEVLANQKDTTHITHFKWAHHKI